MRLINSYFFIDMKAKTVMDKFAVMVKFALFSALSDLAMHAWC